MQPGKAQTYIVCALYKFVRLDNHESLCQPLLDLMLAERVRGTLLLATEGVNGTIAGSRQGVNRVLDWLQQVPGLAELDCKESVSEKLPFKRSRVKLKKEIVTMGVEGIDPRNASGTYVEPQDWNALISDPDVTLIDTRNDYECEVGSFAGSIIPDTESFREFPAYAKQNLDKHKHKKVAMFCTGGIRCEKSTAYLREQGFDEVYHLKGGILKYLEEIPESESLWRGECFVFDDRVTVNHQLEPGTYDQCHGCRRPITDEDKQSPQYIAGAQCPKCCGEISDDQKQRFLEREKQMQLARQRGEAHIGEDAKVLLQSRRQLKRDAKARKPEE